MAELVFILTIVYVAYVVFTVTNCEKRKKEEGSQKAKPVIKQVDSAPPKPEVKNVSARSGRSETVASVEPDSLKNPETGEVVKVGNNYHFMKRWIKEALVKEGLVDKIYKSAELDDETTAKVQTAIEKLKTLEKYH